MYTRYIRAATLALVVLVILSAGCLKDPFQIKIPPQTQLADAGISIIADDGTVALLDTNLQETNANVVSWDCPLRPDTTNYADALSWGAKRVRVKYPGLAEPLYGVLALCPVPGGVTGPASKLYYIRVPQSYVNETSGGRRSVVYEPIKFRWSTGSGPAVTDWPAWILWLSRSPL